ncbi:DUF4345 domain-containing protein [Jiella sp. MQZ9-1]|uniref:DUF4345 domain-containing protein n=1 Tax=Jiella flava TaxID=2816857 RepID=A0A939FWW5_9HYPH|nr:DUF4345 domain-containing protein [Jiella flava]MBO0661660.1 DUF4345 domain-containing protein [Jiella flava]MCD2470302.1 DUF4345 domain-containing protein [Jiella flava]
MDFALPTDLAGWLPFAAACVTILLGLAALFAPRLTLSAIGLAPSAGSRDALGGSRASLAGFWLGVGLIGAALYDQPFVQLALGAGWLMSAFGRLVSLLSDGNSLRASFYLLIELALAAATLAPALGFLPS